MMSVKLLLKCVIGYGSWKEDFMYIHGVFSVWDHLSLVLQCHVFSFKSAAFLHRRCYEVTWFFDLLVFS